MTIWKRDKLGRFTPLKRRRIPTSKSTVKATPKKPTVTKLAKPLPSKKVPLRKVVPSKLPLKKVLPRKVPPKKAQPKKLPLKRVPPKKVPPKKVPPKRVLPKKVPPKKVSPKKVPPKKVLPKKAPPKKALPRKLPSKKLPPKKALPRKLPPKKALPRKLPSKKLPPKKKKLPPKKAPPRKAPPKKRKKAELPLKPLRSAAAEVEIQNKLVSLLELIGMVQPGLDMSIQTFINGDGSVDGELRISNLPENWRTARGLRSLIATLSTAFATFKVFDKEPAIGGGYWATFGVRFGPQNDAEIGDLAELYKRHKGLFQIGTYPVQAWNLGSLQIAITDERTGLRSMISALASKRGLPPSVILIRFIWGPEWAHNSRNRPGHYKGER